MAVESQPIRAAMKLADEARHCEFQQDFKKALKLYEASIEKLFPLVEGRSSEIHEAAISYHRNILFFRWKRHQQKKSNILWS